MRRCGRRATTALTGCGALIAVAAAAAAGFNAGDLDTSFSGDGKANAPLSGIGGVDTAVAMAIQADGKVVLAGNAGGGYSDGEDGDFGVARFNLNGGLDSTWGGDGTVTTSFAPAGSGDEAHAVAIQPADGKVVAAGTVEAGVVNNDFAVVRYDKYGVPDGTFDDDGMVTTDLRDGSFTSSDDARAVAVQSDGKLVVAGTYGIGPGSAFALARYKDDGSLDSTFGGDGTVVTPFCSPCGSGEKALANAVAIQHADGKIVVAGVFWHVSGSYSQADFAVARYDTYGNLDMTFDGDGKVVTPVGTSSIPWDQANALVVLGSGKIVAAGYAILAGSTGENFALVKYNVNGSPDTTFGGGDGIVTTDVSPVHNTSIAYGLAAQSDGRLVAAGMASDYDLGYFHKDYGLVRYNQNGSLDTTFGGGDGIVTTAIGADPNIDIARAVRIAPDGKIVVGGYSDMGPPEYYDYDFTVARYASADTKPPDTIIDSAPPRSTNDPTSTFAFHSTEVGSTFECRVDAGPYAACGSPKTLSTLADGPHTFYVRAKDKAGNVDATPASRYFVVDTVPPDTIIDSGPSGTTNDSTPTFAFHNTETGSTFTCRVDAGSYAGCTSPKTIGPLANGPHTFSVRAKDRAGNVDPTPASRSFSVQV